MAGDVDIVVAESLDRFSRDQEDTAGFFKRLVSLVSASLRWLRARSGTSTWL